MYHYPSLSSENAFERWEQQEPSVIGRNLRAVREVRGQPTASQITFVNINGSKKNKRNSLIPAIISKTETAAPPTRSPKSCWPLIRPDIFLAKRQFFGDASGCTTTPCFPPFYAAWPLAQAGPYRKIDLPKFRSSGELLSFSPNELFAGELFSGVRFLGILVQLPPARRPLFIGGLSIFHKKSIPEQSFFLHLQYLVIDAKVNILVC